MNQDNAKTVLGQLLIVINSLIDKLHKLLNKYIHWDKLLNEKLKQRANPG